MSEPVEQILKTEKLVNDSVRMTVQQKKQALKRRIDEIEYQRELKRIAEDYE